MGVERNVDRNQRRAANRAWQQVPSRTRAEVIKRSKTREVHPDPQVAAVAERWARVNLNQWWNRLPQYILPLLGIVFIAFGLLAADGPFVWFFAVAGVMITVCGLLGWNAHQAMMQIVRAADIHRLRS